MTELGWNLELGSHVAEDLRALGESTARDIPALGISIAAVRSRRARGVRGWKALVMQRPWLVTAAFVVLVSSALLLVPLSYDRTIGQDVALSVAGLADSSQARVVADELRSILAAREVATSPASGAAGTSFRFTTYVPARAGLDVEACARMLARELERRGYQASAVVTPRRERVSGSVYAYAREHVIRIQGAGRTTAEIEAAIRQRLSEEGLTNTRVSVTNDEGMRRIQVERNGPEGPATPGSGERLGIELDGASGLAGSGTGIEVQRLQTEHEGTTVRVDVTLHGRQVSIDVPHAETMSDVSLAGEIQSRLKRAGIGANVSVSQGTIQIHMTR